MTIKEMFLDLDGDVKDIVNLGFELITCQEESIPSYEDPQLNYESGKRKTGKLMETCVLFVDIRNSTIISQANSKETLARLYTAFTKSTLKIAEYHDGAVRNIIGDRVMIVFPKKSCFKRAVDTACSINTTASQIIGKQFPKIDFKVGIGIDYGELKVIKVGIRKMGAERGHNVNLVWIGNTANIASKLTDIANKEIRKYHFIVRYPGSNSSINPYGPLASKYFASHPLLNTSSSDLTEQQFLERFSVEGGGTMRISGNAISSFEKKSIVVNAPAILMTKPVYDGLLAAFPQNDYFTKRLISEQEKLSVKEYSGKIYGGSFVWTI